MDCSVFIAVSLDGFIARADGSVDWLSLVEALGEDYGYQRFFDSIDTLVVGRNSYELAGDGISLFGSASAHDLKLDLLESKGFASGLVQMHYRVRPP